MSMGESGREGSLTNAVSMAARFGLPSKDALRIAEELKSHVAGWEGHFSSHGISGADLDAIRASFTGDVS
jgi:serine/threonine-protein kinase HipA